MWVIISCLGIFPNITIAGLRWFLLAIINSEIIGNTWGDQPRMTVWPLSITFERPSLSSDNFELNPVVRVLINAPEINKPVIKSINIAILKIKFSVTWGYFKTLRKKLKICSVKEISGEDPVIQTKKAIVKTIIASNRVSQRIMLTVPFERELSILYER